MTFSDLPRACGKQELFRLLIDIPERELRNTTNAIISLNRRLPIATARFKKMLRKNEVELVMVHFGYLDSEVFVAETKNPTVLA